MEFIDDSLYPENMDPLIITAAPYGPSWIPGDADIPVTWKEQVQAATDCYNAGATHLHVHVRNRATGQLSKDFDQFNEFIGMLRQAVPKMILSIGGSISFAPKTDDAKAKWLDYDTRHMLTELDPKPDQVTIAIGTGMMDLLQMRSEDDIKGTHLEDNEKAQQVGQACGPMRGLRSTSSTLSGFAQTASNRILCSDTFINLRSSSASSVKGCTWARLTTVWWRSAVAPAVAIRSTGWNICGGPRVNNLIDVLAQQRQALAGHVPTAIVVLTLCLVTLGALSLGVRFALDGTRPLMLSIIYVVAYVIVIEMMIDYDRPKTGFVSVSLTPMTEQLRQMQGAR